MINKTTLFVAAVLGLSCSIHPAGAIPRKLIQATPRGVVASLFVDGRSDEQAGLTAAELIATALSRGGGMGLQVWTPAKRTL